MFGCWLFPIVMPLWLYGVDFGSSCFSVCCLWLWVVPSRWLFSRIRMSQMTMVFLIAGCLLSSSPPSRIVLVGMLRLFSCSFSSSVGL